MTTKPKRRIMSIALFVLAVLVLVLGLAFGIGSERFVFVLFGLVLAAGGLFFYRRGK